MNTMPNTPTSQRLVPGADVCPHCGSKNLRNFTATAHDEDLPATIGVYACNDCAFAWQWPWSRTADSSRAYFDGQYRTGDAGTYFDPENRRKIAELEFAYVRSRIAGPVRMLDVGGGDGVFGTVAAEDGWPVTCVDPALPARDAASGNPRFVRGLLDDLPADERFDVVTLWDVIEHLEQPTAVLEACVARLAPGGTLFVETGNFQSAGRISSGPDWWGYQSDHRWYFTPPVIEDMMKRAGLVDIALHDKVLRPWWNGAKAAAAPRLWPTLSRSIKRPDRTLAHIRMHRELADAAARWPEWSGLEIFVSSGRRPG